MNENENQNVTNEELGLVNTEVKSGSIMSFNDLKNNSQTLSEIYTNIQDKKKLFNIGNKVDFLLNNCENELIRVKGVVVKIYHKPLKEPVIDEETGEIIKDTEMTMSVVLVDSEGRSYATGSKLFGIQLMRYIREFGMDDIESKDGLVIKIIKKEVNGGKNKGLAFEIV